MMNSDEINRIIESASMIVGGYAFTKMEDNMIRVVGLKAPNHASVIRPDGWVLETNMDDIELEIVAAYWKRNKKYMEDKEYA